jgi:hypothetical protein
MNRRQDYKKVEAFFVAYGSHGVTYSDPILRKAESAQAPVDSQRYNCSEIFLRVLRVVRPLEFSHGQSRR